MDGCIAGGRLFVDLVARLEVEGRVEVGRTDKEKKTPDKRQKMIFISSWNKDTHDTNNRGV